MDYNWIKTRLKVAKFKSILNFMQIQHAKNYLELKLSDEFDLTEIDKL